MSQVSALPFCIRLFPLAWSPPPRLIWLGSGRLGGRLWNKGRGVELTAQRRGQRVMHALWHGCCNAYLLLYVSGKDKMATVAIMMLRQVRKWEESWRGKGRKSRLDSASVSADHSAPRSVPDLALTLALVELELHLCRRSANYSCCSRISIGASIHSLSKHGSIDA